MSTLSRREFIAGTGVTGVGLLVGCGRLPWRTQPPPRAYRVGVLLPGVSRFQDTLSQSLSTLGWVDGQNLILEYLFADGHDEQFPALAAELVRRQVDLIVAISTPATVAAKTATSTIPIAMLLGGNPVEIGLISSFARPGGNITGVSFLDRPLSAKRLELLKGAIPHITRVAVFGTVSNPALALVWDDLQGVASALGVQVRLIDVRDAPDLPSAFASLTSDSTDAIMLLSDNVIIINRPRVVDLVAQSRLPAMADRRDFVEAGFLMSYASNQDDMWRLLAAYVDKLLRGAYPADLPVQQPMTFEFVVNMRTAQALGITFPNEIMLQATEVIQ